MIGSALAMKTLEAMGYSELRNPTLHCHRMENRCAHLDIAIEGTHGGHQTSFLISYPWSILWHLSWGPARTWLYAYRSYKCPYNLLGTTSFSMATKNLENHGISTSSSLLYFLPILPYPKIALNILHLAMIAYFQSILPVEPKHSIIAKFNIVLTYHLQ